MGFYQREPFDTAEAIYFEPFEPPPQVGPVIEGHLVITVKGCAPKFSYGFQLVPSNNGTQFTVMGWTGPRAEGCDHYKVTTTQPSRFLSHVTIVGSNKTQTIPVRIILHEDTEKAARAAFA